MPQQKKSPTPPRIEKLDKNFAVKKVKNPLVWKDAFDRCMSLRGLAWLKENRRAKNFRRLPDRAEKELSENVRILSHHPAGAFLSFFSDTTELALKLTYEDALPMNHMPATGMAGAELYIRDGLTWLPAGTARPLTDSLTLTAPLWHAPIAHRREFRIYLPLYKKICTAMVGFSRGAKVEPSPPATGNRPLFFYGTSITQGGCANTPGSDFVSILGRLLDTEVINFGFSGSGRGEPEIARLMREIDAEVFVLDFLGNADAATLKPVLTEFIRLLREKHPITPVVIINQPTFNQTFWDPDHLKKLESKRHTAMQVYLSGREAGDLHLHYIDGFPLVGIPGSFVDGVHPTSHGFALMAEFLAPQLRWILLRTRENALAGNPK